MSPRPPRTKEEIAIVQELYYQPLEFVYFAFPWGEPHNLLKDETGPDDWQSGFLKELGQELYFHKDDEHFVVQEAIAAGHSVGKSAAVCWINYFFMCTRALLRGTVTANTENQLKTKTWAELNKWHSIFRLKHWLNLSATRLSMAGADEMWRVDAIPWSEKNSEAFAGLHAPHVLVQFDESSAIADVIHEVTEGAIVSGRCVWLKYGNPTRRTGKFRENLSSPNWRVRHIDARDAKKANQEKIKEWVDEYGEDSDFVRVRVRGLPPKQGSNQLISEELITNAVDRHVTIIPSAPVIVGVDVARYGDDATVICVRKGLKVYKLIKLQGADTESVCDAVEEAIVDNDADKLVVDSTAPGVIDVMRRRGYQVIDGNFSRVIVDPESYNKRCDMYCKVRDALKAGLSIPNDKELKEDLGVQQFTFRRTKRGDRKILLPKDVLKAEIGRSPDEGDALALTYYETEPVHATGGNTIKMTGMPKIERDYAILS